MNRIVTKCMPFPQIPHIKKVVAYCRVSTQQEMQYNSLTAQRSYYEKLVAKHPEWTLVGIYAGQKSGRNNQKMNDFQRMLAGCCAGKIDLILIKSISRMGRNTVQLLMACNELHSLGVDVFFEVERLHISDPKAVRMLTIFTSMYQNESQGLSLRSISAHLQEQNILSPRGKPKWGIETIRKILNNEKYRGDVLLQKTYIADFFTGRQVPNKGEDAKYLLTGHHEPIIK